VQVLEELLDSVQDAAEAKGLRMKASRAHNSQVSSFSISRWVILYANMGSQTDTRSH